MRYIKATELELLECFAVEPQLLDPGDPWCFNTATYRVVVGGFAIAFTIAPGYKDVEIIVECDGRRWFAFHSMGIKDVKFAGGRGVDALEIIIDSRSSIRFQIRPTVEIVQTIGREE
ncbi:MAG: hypothetical protein ACRDD1_10145 [Planctomycetia bacterium]